MTELIVNTTPISEIIPCGNCRRPLPIKSIVNSIVVSTNETIPDFIKNNQLNIIKCSYCSFEAGVAARTIIIHKILKYAVIVGQPAQSGDRHEYNYHAVLEHQEVIKTWQVKEIFDLENDFELYPFLCDENNIKLRDISFFLTLTKSMTQSEMIEHFLRFSLEIDQVFIPFSVRSRDVVLKFFASLRKNRVSLDAKVYSNFRKELLRRLHLIELHESPRPKVDSFFTEAHLYLFANELRGVSEIKDDVAKDLLISGLDAFDIANVVPTMPSSASFELSKLFDCITLKLSAKLEIDARELEIFNLDGSVNVSKFERIAGNLTSQVDLLQRFDSSGLEEVKLIGQFLLCLGTLLRHPTATIVGSNALGRFYQASDSKEVNPKLFFAFSLIVDCQIMLVNFEIRKQDLVFLGIAAEELSGIYGREGSSDNAIVVAVVASRIYGAIGRKVEAAKLLTSLSKGLVEKGSYHKLIEIIQPEEESLVNALIDGKPDELMELAETALAPYFFAKFESRNCSISYDSVILNIESINAGKQWKKITGSTEKLTGNMDGILKSFVRQYIDKPKDTDEVIRCSIFRSDESSDFFIGGMVFDDGFLSKIDDMRIRASDVKNYSAGQYFAYILEELMGPPPFEWMNDYWFQGLELGDYANTERYLVHEAREIIKRCRILNESDNDNESRASAKSEVARISTKLWQNLTQNGVTTNDFSIEKSLIDLCHHFELHDIEENFLNDLYALFRRDLKTRPDLRDPITFSRMMNRKVRFSLRKYSLHKTSENMEALLAEINLAKVVSYYSEYLNWDEVQIDLFDEFNNFFDNTTPCPLDEIQVVFFMLPSDTFNLGLWLCVVRGSVDDGLMPLLHVFDLNETLNTCRIISDLQDEFTKTKQGQLLSNHQSTIIEQKHKSALLDLSKLILPSKFEDFLNLTTITKLSVFPEHYLSNVPWPAITFVRENNHGGYIWETKNRNRTLDLSIEDFIKKRKVSKNSNSESKKMALFLSNGDCKNEFIYGLDSLKSTVQNAVSESPQVNLDTLDNPSFKQVFHGFQNCDFAAIVSHGKLLDNDGFKLQLNNDSFFAHDLNLLGRAKPKNGAKMVLLCSCFGGKREFSKDFYNRLNPTGASNFLEFGAELVAGSINPLSLQLSEQLLLYLTNSLISGIPVNSGKFYKHMQKDDKFSNELFWSNIIFWR